MSTQTQRLIGAWILTASLSAVAPADVILEYDTGHPLGPHFLTLDEETPLEISVTDRTGEQWGIGAVVFDFAAPDGGLAWDLNGPDDTDFTADDDLVWQNGLGGFLDPHGNPDYFATVDPPLTICSDCCPEGAVPVPPNGTVLLAILRITATTLGEVALDTGLATEGFGIIDNCTASWQQVEDGTERADLTVVGLGDGNGDGIIDLVDFSLFQACFTGDTGAGIDGACLLFDFDSDGDIDLDDYAEFRDATTSP